MMIILNGLLKNLGILIFLLTITLSRILIAEEINVAPLIKLDEIAPSYDEDIISSDIESHQSQDMKPYANEGSNGAPLAEISILNKITANVDTIMIALKENYIYHELRIYAIDCHISGPYEKSELAVYLNIHHTETKEKIFNGWMLKSLPSISSMEHPVYDIWVENCI